MSMPAEDLHPMTSAQWTLLVTFEDVVPVPDSDAWSRSRTALEYAISEELASADGLGPATLAPDVPPQRERAQRVGGFQRDRRRIALVAGVLAISASLVAVGVVLVGGPGISMPTAAAALRQAASNTAGHSPVPGAGQYLELHEKFQIEGIHLERNGKSFTFDIPGSAEWWIPQSGEGEDHVSLGRVIFPTALDRAKWVSAGSPVLAPSGVLDEQFPLSPAQQQEQAAEQGIGALPLGPTVLTQAQVASLPTDPTQLKSVLVKRYLEGYRDPGTLFDLAASLLEEGATPAQRSALFKMVSAIPGVSSTGTATTDVTGQMGTAVTLDNYGFTHEMIFDPTTSVVLEEKTTQDKGLSSSTPTELNGSAQTNETLGFTVFQSPDISKSEPDFDAAP
jgi:hypothetical protein